MSDTFKSLTSSSSPSASASASPSANVAEYVGATVVALGAAEGIVRAFRGPEKGRVEGLIDEALNQPRFKAVAGGAILGAMGLGVIATGGLSLAAVTVLIAMRSGQAATLFLTACGLTGTGSLLLLDKVLGPQLLALAAEAEASAAKAEAEAEKAEKAEKAAIRAEGRAAKQAALAQAHRKRAGRKK